ncbi:MAG TPA: glutamine synthetase family protein [Vicinamibacteria bacterium]|nr:glutamine synthetase family protein [Vicinamibacteria bacterium]
MSAASRSPAAVLDELRRAPGQKVKVAVADVDGVLRGKYLHKDKFLSAAEGGGFGICNVVFGWDSADVCYDNASYTGWHTGYPDAVARIDLSTARTVPWDGGVPFFLADFEDGKGGPLPICPRQVLKKIVARAQSAGYVVKAGLEFEWFNFQETPQSLADKRYVGPTPLTPGMFGYSLVRIGNNRPFFTALMDELSAFGVPLEGLHTETGPGVLEAALQSSDALEAGDRGVLFKTSVKEIAQRFSILPTFMAKWSTALPGCSGHMHQSLWSGDGNAFHDAGEKWNMSRVFKSYLAGQLRALPDLLPFFAPTVNSYKRLVDGYWAPTKVTWGVDNRTVAFRVIPGGPKSTRVEVRVSGSDINPYLALAASIGAGLWGIEKELPLEDEPVVGSAYMVEKAMRLPRSLQEATRRLSESQMAREILGGDVVDHFARTREWEWRQFQDSVTDWELRRYFEVI